jgi:ribonuclease HI
VGGALPEDWDNNDAEAYAIMRYLQSVVERSEEPGKERVLVLSDSRVVLDVIESIWHSGNASLCKSRDRGAMIEAVCKARVKLEHVVFAWCPGHRGVAPNEYADMAAKAHLNENIDCNTTKRIASSVRTRDCLYKMGSNHEEGIWSLADRSCFRLARQSMSTWVQDQLMSTVNTLRYDAALADGRKHNYGHYR